MCLELSLFFSFCQEKHRGVSPSPREVKRVLCNVADHLSLLSPWDLHVESISVPALPPIGKHH